MSDLMNTLPGDIPGILRDGCIIRHNGHRAVVLQVTEGFALVVHHASGTDEEIEVEGGTVPWDLIALDLTDPTGRAHAAWWVYAMRKQHPYLTISHGEDAICMTALLGDELTPKQIDTLARLVLRLAGRTP